jgi:hypothetical protein
MRPLRPRPRVTAGLGALTTATVAVGAAAAAGALGPGADAAVRVAVPPATGSAPSPVAPAPAPSSPGAVAPTHPPAARAAKVRPRLRITTRRLNVLAGRLARVAGRLVPARRGQVVTLERLGARGWRTIDRARTSRSGRFRLAFRTRGVDTARVRVRFAGDRTTRPRQRRLGRLNVFRVAYASWYGPGLYGGRMACGGRLSPGTVGVAHKSLPCGTRVVLRNGRRMVRAAVVDRGPFVAGREFDLTAATRARLGFGSTGPVLVAH